MVGIYLSYHREVGARCRLPQKITVDFYNPNFHMRVHNVNNDDNRLQ
jgi:hypothetical protein